MEAVRHKESLLSKDIRPSPRSHVVSPSCTPCPAQLVRSCFDTSPYTPSPFLARTQQGRSHSKTQDCCAGSAHEQARRQRTRVARRASLTTCQGSLRQSSLDGGER